MRDAEVYVAGGRTPTGRKVIDWAREAEDRGAGEILLTSMDTDGMRNGFDCELTAAVSSAVQIPVIASGGAGTAQHFVDVFGPGAPTPRSPPASSTSASPIPALSKPNWLPPACPCGCHAETRKASTIHQNARSPGNCSSLRSTS